MKLGLEAETTQANLELIKAQTQKTEAEAQNIASVEKDLKTSQWELTKQQVKTEKGKTQINELEASVKSMQNAMMLENYAVLSSSMKAEAQKKYEELEKIARENDIGYSTMQNQIDQVAQDLINSKIQADYMKAEQS